MQRYNLDIKKGTTYTAVFVWADASGNPVNTQNYDGYMHIRDKSTGELLMDCTNFVYTGENPASGEIILEIPGSDASKIDTTHITFKHGIYDIIMKSSSNSYQVIGGNVTVSNTITRVK